VVLELRRQEANFIRLNTEDYPSAIKISWSPTDYSEAYFDIHGQVLPLQSIKSVWYRRPVAPVPSIDVSDPLARAFIIEEARAALAGIWRALDCFWVSHPDSLYAASYKLNQLHVAHKLGFKVPDTLVTNNPSTAETFLSHQQQVVYKTVSMGRISSDNQEADQGIFTSELSEDDRSHIASIKFTPSLFQELIRKAVDIRVTVIGAELFAVAIYSQDNPDSRVDWRRLDPDKLKHKVVELPENVKQLCHDLMQYYRLQFGAIDLILTNEGEYVFLEINPNGQWAWIEQVTGIPLSYTLAKLLIDA